MKPKQYDIILRTCSRANVHSGERVFKGTKTELIIFCLRSLVRSMNLAEADLRLTIFDDHSSAECLESMKESLKESRYPSEIKHLEASGNDSSLLACYEYARDFGREILYFVEDDYVHIPSAISEMIEAHELFTKNLSGGEVGLFPVDYPDRYTPSGIAPARIVLSPCRHWRTVSHSTFTFLISRQALLTHWQYFEKVREHASDFVSEDSSVNLLWQHGVQLFSPIPSLAVHLQFPENLPPFTDWQSRLKS